MAPVSVLLTLGLTAVVALFGSAGSAQAMAVTQLDLTGGSTSYDGRFSRVADRLLDRDGTIVMGQYQPTPDIVSPITKGPRTFSLFTSGVNGAAAPSATINGSSITVDLSSLYFGVSRGDSLRAWNIGGLATGLFNPETSEFWISWSHLFQDRSFSSVAPATFSLQGRLALAEVPAPVTAVLFMTGLIGLLLSPALRTSVLRRFHGRFAANV